VGLRLGTGAVTTRGLKAQDMAHLGHLIADLIEAEAAGSPDAAIRNSAQDIKKLCAKYPV
jgi:glycine hydroxymethyltransferase